MKRKRTCLAGCDCAFYGEDAARLGRRMRDHLRTVHGLPADSTELADRTIPAATGRRSGASGRRPLARSASE